MKKLFSLITIVLFVGSIMAETVTYKQSSASAASVSSGTAPAGSSVTFVNTYTNNKEQITSGNKMTLTLSGYDGYEISGVTVSVHNNKSSGAGSGSLTINGEEKGSLSNISGIGTTYTFKDFSVTPTTVAKDGTIVIVLSCSTNSVFCESFTITYFTPSAVATPTIAPDKQSFQGSTTVSLSCETEGATIYYTLNGDDPTASSTAYSTPFTLNATTTVKAIAIKGEDKSNIASKTYTCYPTEMTCAEARTAALSVSGNDVLYADGFEFTVQGYVTSIQTEWSSTYVSFWMADASNGGKVIEAYKASCDAAEKAPKVGDVVSITGKLTRYNSTPEFAAGATYSIIPMPYVTPAQTSWNFGEDIEQGTKGEDETAHLLKTINLIGANLTDDVKLTVETTGGGAIFFLNGYKSNITISPEAGAINYDIVAIASTSTAGTFAGTITISSLAETPEFEPVVINLSITVLAPVAVTSITLNKNALALEEKEKETLTATILPANATNKAITWKSSNEAIATVDENGLVTAVTPGTATITCASVADNTKYDECVVTVSEHIVYPGTYSIDLNATFFGTTAGSNIPESSVSAKKNDITIEIGTPSGTKPRTDTGYTRLYSSNYLNISVPSGYAITSITFAEPEDTDAQRWEGSITADPEGYDSETKTWSGDSQEIEFSFGAQNRAASVSVTFKEATPSAISNTATEGKAVKSIVNGQLVITRDGHIYNALGVKLN